MGLALITDGDSDQTAWLVVNQQCVDAAGTGAGVPGNWKGMVAGGIGMGSVLEPACQLSASFLSPERTYPNGCPIS